MYSTHESEPVTRLEHNQPPSEPMTSEDYIVKEHFEAYGDQSGLFSKQTVGRSFNLLVDNVSKPYVRTLRKMDEPEPFPGIIVSRRYELGIAPYPKGPAQTDYRSIRLAAFAIHAGSLLDTEHSLTVHLRHGQVREFTLAFIQALKTQISE